jgi:hypothetical protein
MRPSNSFDIIAVADLATALVARGDIAAIGDVTPDAVEQWRRRYPAFPRPVAHTSAGDVWLRTQIETWLRETGRLR